VADSTATAIAAVRPVIVGFSTGGQRAFSAFRYTPESGMVDIGALPGATESRAYAVDMFGDTIVGDCTYPDGHHVAFIWKPGQGMRDLRQVLLTAGSPIPFEWTLETAIGVGATGSAIVGTGRDPAGQSVAYLARVFGCYANFDSSTTPPVLNVADYVSFLNAFAAGSLRANCDNSSEAPVLTVSDFTCFMQKFAAGCS
jgi:probable HAF family extracellular repeat protein